MPLDLDSKVIVLQWDETRAERAMIGYDEMW